MAIKIESHIIATIYTFVMCIICLFSTSVAFALPSIDGRCDQLDVNVSITSVPEQNPLTLRDAYEKMEQIPKGADIILLGDSLARKLTPDLAKEIFPGKVVWNYGVGGDTTQNVLWRMRDEKLRSVNPALVIIFVGANNIATGKQSGCAIGAGMKAVTSRAKDLWPAARVVLMPLLPRGPDFNFEDKARLEANRTSEALSINEKSITCEVYGTRMDTRNNYACYPELAAKCKNFELDNIHLTPSGYRTLFKMTGIK